MSTDPRQIPIESCGFGVAFLEKLQENGFRTLGDFADCTKEQANQRGIIKRGYGSVRSVLAGNSLTFKGEVLEEETEESEKVTGGK